MKQYLLKFMSRQFVKKHFEWNKKVTIPQVILENLRIFSAGIYITISHIYL